MRRLSELFGIFGILIFLHGCYTAGPMQLAPGALEVKVGKGDPPDNFQEIAQITGRDGAACGLYGFRGTYERAMIGLKNHAQKLGGEYVEIMTLTEPHLRGGCFDNNYIISGTVYKQTRDLASPTPIVIPSSDNRAILEKLRFLKQLKDEGLISEEQYQKKQGELTK